MKLRIGNYEVPEKCLRYVILYGESGTISFGGIIVEEQNSPTKSNLIRLAEEKAVGFEAIDRNGLGTEGFCNVKHLKFDERNPSIVKFSGQLFRPFHG
ncbi:MAG TPA: hypothetical protein VK503_11375 [Candidatus Bathyarchaeia archaeon]|nr:hypothetical protein [Candidatus Bathyarchaeia archaeon]